MSNDQDRYESVRLESGFDGEERILIPVWPDDEVPALLRAVADAWEAANRRQDSSGLVPGPCEHVWQDSRVRGFRPSCLVCGALL